MMLIVINGKSFEISKYEGDLLYEFIVEDKFTGQVFFAQDYDCAISITQQRAMTDAL